jgi:hypothetical protein
MKLSKLFKPILFTVLLFMFISLSIKGSAQVDCPRGWVQSSQTITTLSPNVQSDFVGAYPYVTQAVWDSRVGLNSDISNRFFFGTYKLDGCCRVMRAVLTVKVCPNGIEPQNDGMAINAGGGWRSLGRHYPQNGRIPHCPTPTIITCTLTPAEVTALNASHKLTFFVQDDSRVLSTSLQLTVCCLADAQCNTSFNLTGTTSGAQPGQFIVTASNYSGPSAAGNTWDVPPGCSYWWTVQDITTNAAALGAGALNTGLMSWYGSSGFPTINFPGYDGTGNYNTSMSTGKFLLGHCYRITRGTWTCNGGWHTQSKTICMSGNRSATPTAVVKDDPSYKPSADEVNKIMKNK